MIVFIDAADGGCDTPGWTEDGFYLFTEEMPDHCQLVQPCSMSDGNYGIIQRAVNVMNLRNRRSNRTDRSTTNV